MSVLQSSADCDGGLSAASSVGRSAVKLKQLMQQDAACSKNPVSALSNPPNLDIQ